MDYIPQEILIQILKRLSVKSLHRCRCVSKSWNSTITSPHFIFAHLNYTTTNKIADLPPLLLVCRCVITDNNRCDYEDKDTLFSLRIDDKTFREHSTLEIPSEKPDGGRFRNFRFVGSCHGLVLLGQERNYHLGKLVLWNPSIRKMMALPPPPNHQFGAYSCVVAGFGFDPWANDFKVVRIVSTRREKHSFHGPMEVEIYSLNTGHWKSVNVDFGTFSMFGPGLKQFIFKGIVYWLVSRLVDDMRVNFVLFFNPSDESFGEIILPEGLAGDWIGDMFIFMYNGSFPVFLRRNLHCQLWVMREFGMVESWTKIFDFELRRGLRSVVGFRENGLVLMERYSSRLVSFNPSSKVIKELGITGRSGSFLAIPYVESLVLLDGPGETKFDEPLNKKRKKGPLEAVQVEQAGTSKEEAMQPRDKVVVKNARSINAQVNEVSIPVDIGQELIALKSAVRSLRDDTSAAIESLRSEIRTSFQSLRSELLSKQA